MNRFDLSPTRRRTRNVIAAPIPHNLIESTVGTVDRVPDWVNPSVFIIHMIAGISVLANVMMYGLEKRFAILIIISAFLLVTVAINSHFPSRTKRWFFATTDILAVLGLRIACELTIVADPNTTMVLLMASVCLIFALYLDPYLSKALAATILVGATILLTPYMLPQIFEDVFRANLSHTRPLESLLLLVALCTTSAAFIFIATSHRRWRLANATRFLEKVQIALVTRRN